MPAAKRDARLKGRKMNPDLYLKNAQVVTETEVFHGGVIVEGEQITGVIRGNHAIEE